MYALKFSSRLLNQLQVSPTATPQTSCSIRYAPQPTMETSVNITLKGESRYPRLSFISIHDPNESKRPAERKAVRSHAAFYHHNIDRATQDSASKYSKSNIPTANSKARRRKRRRDIIIPLEVRDANPAERDTTNDDGTKRQAEVFEKMARQILRPVNRVIGQGRNDPFQTYPVPWEPIIPELVDHCEYQYMSTYILLFWLSASPP